MTLRPHLSLETLTLSHVAGHQRRVVYEHKVVHVVDCRFFEIPEQMWFGFGMPPLIARMQWDMWKYFEEKGCADIPDEYACCVKAVCSRERVVVSVSISAYWCRARLHGKTMCAEALHEYLHWQTSRAALATASAR